jgi:hypothetical protein
MRVLAFVADDIVEAGRERAPEVNFRQLLSTSEPLRLTSVGEKQAKIV